MGQAAWARDMHTGHRAQAFPRMLRRRARGGLCRHPPGQALSLGSLGGGGASVFQDGQGLLCADSQGKTWE